MSDHRSSHLSSLAQDALAQGALAPAAAARAEEHLQVCERCRADAAALLASRDHFLGSVLPRTLPTVRERLAPRRRLRWLWIAAPALAAAIVLLVVLRSPAGIGTSPASIPDDLRIKGDTALQVIAHRDGRTWSIAEDNRVAAGDALRFVVAPGGATHVLVVSVDGAGAATIYVPYGGAESAPLAPGPRVELPGSIVLDDAPGPERIVALFSRAPLPAAGVRTALERLGAQGASSIPGLPPGVEQASVLLEKPAP